MTQWLRPHKLHQPSLTPQHLPGCVVTAFGCRTMPTDIKKSPTGCTCENPDPASFQSWCKKHSVLWQTCTMGMSAATGRCVLAARDIAPGEVVVQVPDDMVLMAENCSIQAQLEGDGLTKPADDALLEVQGLVIAVMYEKALSSASKWGPYLAFLPSDMSHMMVYWTESELAELQGTAALDKLVGRVQHAADAPTRVRQLFEELVVPFVLGHKQVAAALLGGSKAAAKASEEEAREKLWQPYLWATSAVASYSFVLGDDHYQGMVAVWDLLNHITGAVNVRLHHDPEAGVLQMVAIEPIPKGQEVVNCYGHLSNAELLRGYGYVEQHNPIKHVQVPAHFCIKAAAAPASAAGSDATGTQGAGKQGRKPAGADGGGSDAVGSDSELGEEHEEASAPNSQDESSDGEDESSSDDGDGSASEPDWDLEDDEPEQLQQQQERQQQYWAQRLQQQQGQQGQQGQGEQQQGDTRPKKKRKQQGQSKQQQQQQAQGVAASVPSLAAAQALIDDWEERWQLCFSLGLLPKNGVLQVPAGGLASCPGQLLAILLLLLAHPRDCVALAAASAAATNAAVSAAAAAADEAGKGSQGKGRSKKPGSSGGKKQQPQEQEQKGKKLQAANRASSRPQDPESGDTAAQEAAVEAHLTALKFASPAQLAAALQHLVTLMVCRYPTTLQQDLALLQQQQQEDKEAGDGLPPRLVAALMARSAEKEVWRDLQLELDDAGMPDQAMQQARDCLLQAVLSTAHRAAAKAGQKRGSSCSKQGCGHNHYGGHCHAHDHAAADSEGDAEAEQHEQEQKQAKQQRSKQAAAGAEEAAGFSFNFDL